MLSKKTLYLSIAILFLLTPFHTIINVKGVNNNYNISENTLTDLPDRDIHLYYINIPNLNRSWVYDPNEVYEGLKYAVEESINNTVVRLVDYYYHIHNITSVASFKNLVLNPPENAIIFNAHGGTIPIPRVFAQNDGGSHRDAGDSRSDAVLIVPGTKYGYMERLGGVYDIDWDSMDYYKFYVTQGYTVVIDITIHSYDYDNLYARFYRPDGYYYEKWSSGKVISLRVTLYREAWGTWYFYVKLDPSRGYPMKSRYKITLSIRYLPWHPYSRSTQYNLKNAKESNYLEPLTSDSSEIEIDIYHLQREWIKLISRVTRDFGWIWVNPAGYPFYYLHCNSINFFKKIGTDGLKIFMLQNDIILNETNEIIAKKTNIAEERLAFKNVYKKFHNINSVYAGFLLSRNYTLFRTPLEFGAYYVYSEGSPYNNYWALLDIVLNATDYDNSKSGNMVIFGAKKRVSTDPENYGDEWLKGYLPTVLGLEIAKAYITERDGTTIFYGIFPVHNYEIIRLLPGGYGIKIDDKLGTVSVLDLLIFTYCRGYIIHIFGESGLYAYPTYVDMNIYNHDNEAYLYHITITNDIGVEGGIADYSFTNNMFWNLLSLASNLLPGEIEIIFNIALLPIPIIEKAGSFSIDGQDTNNVSIYNVPINNEEFDRYSYGVYHIRIMILQPDSLPSSSHNIHLNVKYWLGVSYASIMTAKMYKVVDSLDLDVIVLDWYVAEG